MSNFSENAHHSTHLADIGYRTVDSDSLYQLLDTTENHCKWKFSVRKKFRKSMEKRNHGIDLHIHPVHNIGY